MAIPEATPSTKPPFWIEGLGRATCDLDPRECGRSTTTTQKGKSVIICEYQPENKEESNYKTFCEKG